MSTLRRQLQMLTEMSSASPIPNSSFLLAELTAVVSALIGGAKYGVKIRLPHALVMTFLFRKDLSTKKKLRTILKLVVEHASNLAAFATIYKVALAVLKTSSRCLRSGVGLKENQTMSLKSLGRTLVSLIIDGPFSSDSKALIKPGEPEKHYHALLAGATGGYLIWGRYSSVNHQIVLYLTSRILVGLAKRGWEYVYERPGHFGNNSTTDDILQHSQTYPVLAATVWGIVMLLFEESPHVLHRSLKKSMDEIYRL